MSTNSRLVVSAAALVTIGLLAGCGSSGGNSNLAAATGSAAEATPTVTVTETVTETPTAEPVEESTAAPTSTASATAVATASTKVCGTRVPPKTSSVAAVLAAPVPDRVTFCIYPEQAAEGDVHAAKADPSRTLKILRTSTTKESNRICTMEAPLPAAFVLQYDGGTKRAVQVFNGGCRRVMEPNGDARWLTDAGAEYLDALSSAAIPQD